jgi:hypothetical protein
MISRCLGIRLAGRLPLQAGVLQSAYLRGHPPPQCLQVQVRIIDSRGSRSQGIVRTNTPAS